MASESTVADLPAPDGIITQVSPDAPQTRTKLVSKTNSKRGKPSAKSAEAGVVAGPGARGDADADAQPNSPSNMNGKVPAGNETTGSSGAPGVPPHGGALHEATSAEKEEKKDSSQATHISAEHPKLTNSRPSDKQKSSPKPSLVTRILYILVPCIGPSPRRHATDVDKTAPSPSPSSSATALKEKPTLKDKDKESQTLTTNESFADRHDAEPSTSLLVPPSTSSHLAPPQLSTDPAIIVPPSPKTHVLPKSETEGVTSGAVQPPGSTGEESVAVRSHEHEHDVGEESDGTSFTEDEEGDEGHGADEMMEDEDERLILNGGAGIPIGPDGQPRPLLPPVAPHHMGRKCLVLDLDETLVHSSFKSIQQADYVVPVEIEYHWHNVYVIKRPGVDNFLKRMGELYEVVVFTASLSKYADPVLDKLDIHQVVSHRLFRESCYNHKGNYVKDLSQLGRPIEDTIILDNSPASYIFHPNNAVPVSSWFNDPHDTELTDLCPFLADLRTVDDVRGILDGGV